MTLTGARMGPGPLLIDLCVGIVVLGTGPMRDQRNSLTSGGAQTVGGTVAPFLGTGRSGSPAAA